MTANRHERRKKRKLGKANGQKVKRKQHVGDQIATAVKRGDLKTAAGLLQQVVRQAQPKRPNEQAEPVVVGVQLEDVTDTVCSSICPACGAPTVKQRLPHDMVMRLRGGQRVDVSCSNCGQTQSLEVQGSRIVTPQQHVALARRGL